MWWSRKGFLLATPMLLVFTIGAHWMNEKRIDGVAASEIFKTPALASLASAACAGNTAGVAAALRAGADPNGLSVDGGTPLLWAVKCDNAIGVELILKAGANPNYLNRGRVPAILSAAASGKPGVLKVLLAHGANPNVADGEWTPFRYSLAWGNKTGDWRNYYTLLNGGADIEFERDSGSTVAIDAAVMDNFDKVYELIQRGYNKNLKLLGATVQVSNVEGAQTDWKEKVIRLLEKRGVHFPVPPLHPLQKVRPVSSEITPSGGETST